MKLFLLTLFVVSVSTSPIPDEDVGPVEMIVNGVAPGEPLEIGDIVDIKLKEHANGEIIATNLLHPYTAVGIAEAAAAEEPIDLPLPPLPEVIIPEPVILPEPALPEVIVPEPVILPEPALPEVVVPEPVILPEPALPEVIIPEPVILPEPALPEVIVPGPVILPEVVVPGPVILPEPVAPEESLPEAEIPAPSEPADNNEIYNNGVVSVSVNTPQEPTVLSTLQSWLSIVLNYFNADVQTSEQIV